MIHARFISDNSICSTVDYALEPNKYRGLIECIECNVKTWFIKGYATDKIDRMACFAAYHADGCLASTVALVSDDEDNEHGEEIGKTTSDIKIDLDKSGSKSIYISDENEKHGQEDSLWVSASNKKVICGSSGFPINKSLRQLLTHLCNNENYGDKNQSITILADSGRVVLDGKLTDFLVPIEHLDNIDFKDTKIYWGTINNLNERSDGSLWLNYGDYLTEPSILMDETLKSDLIRNFKLKEINELDGSDVILVGHAHTSSNGKVIIKTAFTKYISFRRHKIINKDTEVN